MNKVFKYARNMTGYVCIKVTLRCVRVTTVAVEKQLALRILSACLWLSYPACKAHSPYYIFHLWTVRLYHIISQMAQFSKKKKNTEHKMCVFISLQLLSETFLILRRSE